MRRVRLLWAVASLAIIGTSGAYGAWYLTTSDICLTENCRAARLQIQRATLDAADAQARATWTDVVQAVGQRVTIARLIGESGRGSLDARQSVIQAGIDRQNFLVSGLDMPALAGFARPMVTQMFALRNQGATLNRRFAATTAPVVDAIEQVELVRQGNAVAHSGAQADRLAAGADQLGHACAAALSGLAADGLMPPERANELARQLAANATGLREAMTTYDDAVRRANNLRRDAPPSLATGRVMFGPVSPALINGNADLGRSLAHPAYAVPPEAPPTVSPAPIRDTVLRQRLSAEQDIQRLGAETAAARQQAADIHDRPESVPWLSAPIGQPGR